MFTVNCINIYKYVYYTYTYVSTPTQWLIVSNSVFIINNNNMIIIRCMYRKDEIYAEDDQRKKLDKEKEGAANCPYD